MNNANQKKECIYCAELIKETADYCKHCTKKQFNYEFPNLVMIITGCFEFTVLALFILLLLSTWDDGSSARVTFALNRIDKIFLVLGAITLVFGTYWAFCSHAGSRIFYRRLKGDKLKLVSGEYRGAVKRIKLYSKIGLVAIVSITLLRMFKPTKSSHEAYIDEHTEFISAEITHFDEIPVASFTAVSTEDYDVIFVGIGGKVFRGWTKR